MVIPVALLALLHSSTPGPARDVYFEQTTVVTAEGQPTGPGVVSKVWYAGKKMRMEAGDGSAALILRLDMGKAYRLDMTKREAVEVDAERLRAKAHTDLTMAGEVMGAGEEGAARTRPLKNARTISGYPCQGFRISAGATIMDIYLTDKIPAGVEVFTDFLDWSGASQSLAGLLSEVQKLPGFPLETRSRITVLGQVTETLSTVTKVMLGRHRADLFELPQGYRLVQEKDR